MAENGLPHVPLYGNPQHYSRDALSISPFGYVQFDPMREFFNFNLPFEDNFQTFPDTMVAPLWRGDVRMPSSTFDWDTLRYKHVVYGVVTDTHYIFQWDGGEEWPAFLSGNSNPDPDAYFNIQTIISTDINFEEGTPEIVYAYKTLSTDKSSVWFNRVTWLLG